MNVMPTIRFHSQMDMLQKVARLNFDGNVTCDNGCNWCCHQPVAVTVNEAHLIHFLVQKYEIPLDHDRIEKQIGWGADSDKWKDQPMEDRRCGFLSDEGHCMIYEYRPLVCRAMITAMPEEDCRKGHEEFGPIDVLVDEKTRLLEEQAFSGQKVVLSNLLGQIIESEAAA